MKYFLWLFLYLNISIAFSQSLPKTNGVILQCSEKTGQSLINSLAEKRFENSKLENLGKNTQLFLITTGENDKVLFDFCKNKKGVEAIEYNYELEQRVKPNDSRINEQYHLNLIKAYESWDITTGGKDFAGKDVVIGIIDDGYEILHEDLSENIYINPDEIANDGADNDNNGFKDDINGWNIRTSTGTHDVKSHGTNILGVLGAKGNNQKGITGINWSVKLLPVTVGSFVSDVIKGYDYLIKEKTLYNTSGGTKGANIVVSSYSGGLGKAFAVDHPLWCAVYDKLGLQGTLSVVATTNENDNVEVVGDMPSTCSSPYIVVVNSTDKLDEKDASTGFGNVSVDISAPGELILTTDIVSKGKYKSESGTSLSTPMVASTVALLYSLKCEAFNSFVKSDGKNSALAVKDAIMSSTDQKTSLAGKTVSGGRLNVLKSMNKLLTDYCTKELAPKGELKINQVKYVSGQITVDYVSPDTKPLTLMVFNSSGKEVYKTTLVPPLFGKKEFTFTLDNQFPGLYYFCSLIEGQNVASRGFASQDVSK